MRGLCDNMRTFRDSLRRFGESIRKPIANSSHPSEIGALISYLVLLVVMLFFSPLNVSFNGSNTLVREEEAVLFCYELIVILCFFVLSSWCLGQAFFGYFI